MITRTRLLNKIAGTPGGIWLIEAGAGSGKTVLLNQLDLGAVVARPARPRSKNDMAAFLRGLGHQGPILPDPLASTLALLQGRSAVVIDDLDQWSDDVAVFLSQLIDAFTEPIPVILAARSLPPGIDDLRPGATILRFSDLAFDSAETAEALAPHDVQQTVAEAIHDRCNGLPAAIAAIAGQLAGGITVGDLLSNFERLIDGLLHPNLRHLGDSDLHAAKICAHLVRFDVEIAELIGSPGVVTRLKQAGLPLETGDDGWSQVPDFIRSSLARSLPEPFKIPTSVIEHFVDRGEIPAAIQSCLTVGDHLAAAELIANVSFSQLSQLEPGALGSAMTTIGEVADERPRALLVHAQINASFGEVEAGLRHLERAMRSVETNDPRLTAAASIEIVLELSMWRILHGDPAPAQELLERCVPHIQVDARGPLNARVHEIRGLISHTRGSLEDLETAASEQLKALAIWRQLAEPRPAAVTVFRLAAGPLFALGRHSEALQLIDDLPSVGPMTLLNQARAALEKAILLPYLGRSKEVPALAKQTRQMAQVLGHRWLESWVLLTEIVAASFELDSGPRVTILVDQFIAEEHFVLNDFTQFLAWCEIAEALARCDDAEQAFSALKRATELGGPPVLVQMSSASVEARCGDPETALLALADLKRRDDVPFGQRWLLDLLAALCHWRQGNGVDAQICLQACLVAAPLDGPLSLPRIVEQRIVQRLEQTEPTARDQATQSSQIRVFDQFEIIINGEPQRTPKSNATTLLKLLVLHDGQMLIDQAIDPLWPDADLVVGRRRLRNVVARIRASYGQIIVRDGDLVKLGANVSSDLRAARSIAVEALLPNGSADQLDAAIDQLDRELLPENRYDDWAEQGRSDNQQLLVQLLDRRARLA